MQNYEDFLDKQKPFNKSVKDSATAIVNAQKRVQKNVETGNLTEAKKQLNLLRDTIAQLSAQAEALQTEIESFDTQDYFVSGDFTRQLLESCKTKEIDVKGEKGVYEMFPYKIRINGDDERPGEIWIKPCNRRVNA